MATKTVLTQDGSTLHGVGLRRGRYERHDLKRLRRPRYSYRCLEALPAMEQDATWRHNAECCSAEFTTVGAAGEWDRLPRTAGVPYITAIVPSSVASGGGDLTLVVYGRNFTLASGVEGDAVAKTTVFVSPTHLTATIPALDTATPGSIAITVVTAAPGGGTSNAVTLTVT